nr:putative F-box protein PP2-B12 [Quercus suber]
MAEAERERLRSNPELPEECMREIVSRLNPKEWCRGCAVSQTFREACESDENWVTFLPPDWFAILSRTSAHLHFTSLKQLYLHLSDNPFLIDGNSMQSFFLDKMSGKKCYLLSARDLCIIWGDTPFWSWVSKPESRFLPKSRFLQVAVLDLVWRFDIHCKISTSMLSPKTNYATYLVFKLRSRASGFGSRYPLNASITTTQGGEVYEQTVCLSSLAREPRLQRKDGWLEPKMGDLFNEGGKNDELEIRLREIESGRCKSGLVFEGIEIRPTNELFLGQIEW